MDDQKQNIEEIVQAGNKLWADVKAKVKNDPDFINLSDNDKIKFFSREHKSYMDLYPVVSRYAICMGQYSSKALRRTLNKIRTAPEVPMEQRSSENTRDQWLRSKADYVAFLWEAYQRGHIDYKIRNMVWQEAYETLKGEVDDFQDKYKKVERATKQEHKKLCSLNAKELIEHLTYSDKSLDDESMQRLSYLLKNQVYKHRFSLALKDLLKKVKPLEPHRVAAGQGPEHQRPRPTIKMIEHVDADRMDEIPEQYKRV